MFQRSDFVSNKGVPFCFFFMARGIRKITRCWAGWKSWKPLEELDLLGLVSQFCIIFYSTPDRFPRSSTSTRFTDFIIFWILAYSLWSLDIFQLLHSQRKSHKRLVLLSWPQCTHHNNHSKQKRTRWWLNKEMSNPRIMGNSGPSIINKKSSQQNMKREVLHIRANITLLTGHYCHSRSSNRAWY